MLSLSVTRFGTVATPSLQNHRVLGYAILIALLCLVTTDAASERKYIRNKFGYILKRGDNVKAQKRDLRPACGTITKVHECDQCYDHHGIYMDSVDIMFSDGEEECIPVHWIVTIFDAKALVVGHYVKSYSKAQGDVKDRCPECQGAGKVPGRMWGKNKCKTCEGSGNVNVPRKHLIKSSTPVQGCIKSVNGDGTVDIRFSDGSAFGSVYKISVDWIVEYGYKSINFDTHGLTWVTVRKENVARKYVPQAPQQHEKGRQQLQDDLRKIKLMIHSTV